MNQYIERLSALGRCAVAGLLAAVLVAGCGGGGGGEGSSPPPGGGGSTAVAPSVTAQPANATVTAGQTATFSPSSRSPAGKVVLAYS